MAAFVAGIIMRSFGIQGEWSYYIIVYSLIGFGGAFISLAFSRSFAKKIMGVRLIDSESSDSEERELVEMVYKIASHARLPRPEVGIYESPQPNAFATGPSKKKALVAFSRGLLNAMNKQELEGVVAHELAHIANGDMVTMTLLQGLINTMVLLAARFIAKIILSKQRNRSFWMEHLIFMMLQLVFSVLGAVVLCYFSRAREFRADKGGARFSSIENMILALKALERFSTQDSMFQKAGVAGNPRIESYNYLQISGKKSKRSLLSMFSTHPPLSERIARLERFYS